MMNFTVLSLLASLHNPRITLCVWLKCYDCAIVIVLTNSSRLPPYQEFV
jgi:hypothetical protein